jgi:hypothetical protein
LPQPTHSSAASEGSATHIALPPTTGDRTTSDDAGSSSRQEPIENPSEDDDEAEKAPDQRADQSKAAKTKKGRDSGTTVSKITWMHLTGTSD